MARKKDWRASRDFLPGDRVMDILGQRRGKVVERTGEERVRVKFEDSDEAEEISPGQLKRLMQ
jgi:membrane protein implicated in regulation of membrane protease activity